MPALNKRPVILALMALAHALPVPGARAATPSARLLIGTESNHFVGEAVECFIIIEDSGPVPDPEMPPCEDFALHLEGALASEHEGRQRYTLTLRAIPLRAGRLVFPAIEISTGSTLLRTPARELAVDEPAVSDEMQLEITLSQQRCYVRQPVTLTFSWDSALSFNGMRAVRSRLPALDHASLRAYPTLTGIRPDHPRAIGLPVGGERVIARVEVDGGTHRRDRITFQRVLVPTRPGIIEIEPATLLCAFTPPGENRFKTPRYPSYFNNDFFNDDVPGSYRKLSCQSRPLRLEVLPLPEAGRPEGLKDDEIAIGAFSLDAWADPASLPVGSPMTLTLRASGHPCPRALDFPGLDRISSAGVRFELSATTSPARLEGREVVQTYSLRPNDPAITEIPPIRMPYFDPASGNYGAAVTEAIPIRILPEARATAGEAEFGDGSRLRASITPLPGGLPANHEGEDLLVARHRARPITGSPPWWLFLATPPAAFVIALLRHRHGSRIAADPARHRARRAGRAYRRARSAGTPAPQAARDYLADRLHRRRGADTLAELAALAAEHGAPRAAIATLLQVGAAQLADTYGPRDPIAGEADRPLDEIDRAVAQIDATRTCRPL